MPSPRAIQGKITTGHVTQIRNWTRESSNVTLGDFISGDGIPFRVSQNRTRKLRTAHAQEKKDETKLRVDCTSEVSKCVVNLKSPEEDKIEVENLGAETFLEIGDYSVNNNAVEIDFEQTVDTLFNSHVKTNKVSLDSKQPEVFENSLKEQDYGVDRLSDNLQRSKTKVRIFIKPGRTKLSSSHQFTLTRQACKLT